MSEGAVMRRALVLVLLVACSHSAAPQARTVTGPPHPQLPTIPGAVNPNVTNDNAIVTICKGGYSTSVRPPEAYTERLKRKQIRALHLADAKLGDYEEDHLIPLELGGDPMSTDNLWPEPHSQSYAKDRLENSLHADVCAHRITLDAARQQMLDYTKTHG